MSVGEGILFGSGKGKNLKVDITVYLDGLYSYAMALSRNAAEAEDLVQETCLRAIRATARLRPESNVKSWLFTILRHIWLNELRHRRTAPRTLEFDPEQTVSNSTREAPKDPHAIYVTRLEREQVRAAIQQLPEEFREIILLREFEELPYQDIAAILNCPVGTVMSRLARARARLRDLLPAASAALPSQEKSQVARLMSPYTGVTGDDAPPIHRRKRTGDEP